MTGVSSAWLAAAWPEILSASDHARHAAASAPDTFEFFTPAQAAEVEAIAAQIIPTDQTPGAREAGAVHFIDRALATFDAGKRALYQSGLEDLRQRCAAKAPSFSALASGDQIEILKAIEQTEFFEAVRLHTLIGFFANEEYGGNRNHAGWKLIGFEDEHSFEPPFGYYDRPENMGGESK